MNRRKFIQNSVVVTSLSLIGLGGFEIYNRFRAPDYNDLAKSKLLIAEMCETIIPRTDTPGAKDAKVEEYIIHMIRTQMSRADSNKMIDGLKKVEKYSLDQYGKNFTRCSLDERTTTLLALSKSPGMLKFPRLEKLKERISGGSFMDMFKNLAVIGFCTSELGATQCLSYIHIPVDFIPCMPLARGQKSWATK